MTVTLGTDASAYANRSLAPCRMIPPNSCSVPGKNPGTSTKVTRGMLNALQKRTNRAALLLALMSRHPARVSGLFPTTPTVWPSIRANPVTMFCAISGMISKMSPWSTICRIMSFMSYGVLGSSGTSRSTSGTSRSGGSVASLTGRLARSLELGKKSRSLLMALMAATSFSNFPCATPLLLTCTLDPPRSSLVTSSLVTVLTTSGPVTNMYEVDSTMKIKSVMAGL
mmetsp:Transcript_16976/g.46641  ORF Transcript_16976/g.46641 Transcript_16976/m.46641 type:complete len:226 (+) Transcript_16976:661-1338(+)